MRFLYKRPRIDAIQEELETLMEVMASDVFIYFDLFVFSLIFTLFLSPVLKSLALSILFLAACFSLFSCIYFFMVSRLFGKD